MIWEVLVNDYVNLLYNSCWARKYNIQLPDIKWETISGGIHKQIEKMIHTGEEQPRHRMIIGDDNKDLFLPEEWNAYKIINDFLSSNTLMFEKNKALYVNLMKKEPLNALAQTQNKRFDMFDVEMVHIAPPNGRFCGANRPGCASCRPRCGA